MLLTPDSLRMPNLIPSRLRRADFVVMLMTPFPARAPYSDAPAAPFTTSTFSISLGFKSDRLPLMMTPSTMYSGSWPRPEALIEVGPRSNTAGCEPGRPLADTMFAPGTLPWSWVSGFDAGTGSCDASTRDTENGTFRPGRPRAGNQQRQRCDHGEEQATTIVGHWDILS